MGRNERVMEVVDGRDVLGIVVLRETKNGGVTSEIKGLRIDKLTAAKLFYQMAKQLKALHAAECTCFATPESEWVTHHGAVEPGSQLEPNPDCPVHFPAALTTKDAHK